MTGVDIVITGGKVVTTDGTFEASIAIADEIIVAIGPRDALPQARETIDASGKYVLPGAIDSHVHFGRPATIQTGRPAPAALPARGDRRVFEMPNTRSRRPGRWSAATEAGDRQRAGLRRLRHLRAARREQHRQLEALMDAGVSSFNASWQHFGDLPAPRPTVMLEGFEISRAAAAVHRARRERVDHGAPAGGSRLPSA
jgi:dihydroorotase